jgi:hypothetical protein
MSVAEFENFLDATKHKTAVQRAEDFGIDISLIDENLRLTPIQRIRQNDMAMNQSEFLQASLNQTRAKSGTDRLSTC